MIDLRLTNLAESFIWNMPGLLVSKDINFRQLPYCNELYVNLIGYKSLDETVGLFDDQMRCDASSSADVFRKQDREAMNGKDLTLLDIHRYADGKTWVLLTNKRQLRDQNKKVIGCVVHATEITNSILARFATQLLPIAA